MARRYPVCWLMSDERLGPLAPVLRRLPPRSGVVFRHCATQAAERRALLRQTARIACARRLVLVAAGAGVPGGGAYGPGPGWSLRTASAHSRREAIAARRAGATIAFVSPLFATRSHPGARAIGPAKAARFAQGLGMWVVALGGMDARRWRQARHWGFDGWAAIDAWARD